MKRKKQPDLLPNLGKSCHWVFNDHPPMCQYAGNSCLKCDVYNDELCYLIPYDIGKMTEDEKTLYLLRKKRDALYVELDPIYKKIQALADPINEYLEKVRKARGR